jgi:hypothetical protein
VSLSAKEAAELVGMSKAGILKAIKTGKVSAGKDLNGEWRIEPVELFRVYAPVHTNGHTPVAASPQPSGQESTGGLQREIDLLREMVGDLRQRLDAEVEERRKLTFLLTEVRSAPPQPQRKGWWARLLGGA